ALDRRLLHEPPPHALERWAAAHGFFMPAWRAIHGERGELERRSRRALELGDAGHLRFGLGPDVLIEEALLREGAAQLERWRAERRAAQRRGFAFEGLGRDEGVL